MVNLRETDVLIVGAGISGLSSAHFLKKQGLNAVIVEKSDRAGGAIRSERKEGFLIEFGPNSTLDTSPVIHELFADLGIENQMEYANEQSNIRYIVRNERLNALPMGPLAFLKTPHFSSGAKLRLLKEPFVKASDPSWDESLAEFVIRRLGREFLDYAIDPFVAGVYAGLPERLSVKSGFPKLYDLEQKYGSLIRGAILGARKRKKRKEVSKQSAKLFSFPEGMQTMINILSDENREFLHLNSSIQDVIPVNRGYRVTILNENRLSTARAKALLLTIPIHGFEHVTSSLFHPVLPALNRVEYPPVTMVYFGFLQNPAPRPLKGFGFLVPKKENRKILGTIWSSSIFSRRAPAGGVALTTFVGGSRQPELALMPEDKIIENVSADLKELMGVELKPDVVVVKQWPRAIPQYNIGHQEIIQQVEAFEAEHPGIYLSGNFRGGISVGDCIKQAKSLSQKIKDEMEGLLHPEETKRN